MTTTLATLRVPTLFELKLSVAFWQQQRAEKALKAAEAWQLYSELIDAERPREEVKMIGDLATELDREASEAYQQHEAAKALYLAMWN